MAPDSASAYDEPPGPSGSTIAGILLFGLMRRNSSSNCSPRVISMGWTSYAQPSSSSMIDILWPFGVGQ